MAKIAIIGGGVIGSSTAYYLASAGHAADVVVIEPDPTYEFAATPRATGGIRQRPDCHGVGADPLDRPPRETGLRLTHRWREPDSNSRSYRERTGCGRWP
jgi:glycine/D-amino acid oxidase-like deaminating enzyme